MQPWESSLTGFKKGVGGVGWGGVGGGPQWSVAIICCCLCQALVINLLVSNFKILIVS